MTITKHDFCSAIFYKMAFYAERSEGETGLMKENIKIARELIGVAKSLVSKETEKAGIYLEYEKVSKIKVLFFASFDCEREALNDSEMRKLARDCEEKIKSTIAEIRKRVDDSLCDYYSPSFTSNFSGYANSRVYVKGIGQRYADVNTSGDVKPICDVLKKLGYKEM